MTRTYDFRDFRTPLEITDRTDLTYELRLELLQNWSEHLAQSNAEEEEIEEVTAAIHALEMGAVVQGDTPEEVPVDYYRSGPD